MTDGQWNPDQYEKFKLERSTPFWDLVDLIDPKGLKTALDLGCGTGELTLALKKKFNLEMVLGIDSSEEMLQRTTKLTESPDLVADSSLVFKLNPIETFEPSMVFDLVFSNAALQWLPDHEVLLPKIFSWVAPAGQVAIQVPTNFDHVSHRTAYEVAGELFGTRVRGLGQRRSVLEVERYAKILYEAGFEECRTKLEVYLHPMKTGEEVFEWTKGTLLNSFQTQLNASEFEKFSELYRERLLTKVGHGPYVYTFKRILMWGKKIKRPNASFKRS